MKRRTKENIFFVFIGILFIAIIVSGIIGRPDIAEYIAGGMVIIGLISMVIAFIHNVIEERREEDKVQLKN